MVENATLPEKLHPYLVELQAENGRLQQMVAELLLSNQKLRDEVEVSCRKLIKHMDRQFMD